MTSIKTIFTIIFFIVIISCETKEQEIIVTKSPDTQVVTKDMKLTQLPITQNNSNIISNNFSVILDNQSMAKYEVTETFADVPNPVKAIGTTNNIIGQINFDDNNLNTTSSVIKIDLRTLSSDSDRRDNYIKKRTLDTSNFPFAELKINSIEGLTFPLTNNTFSNVTINGMLKIKDLESETIWNGNLQIQDNETSGKFKTSISFSQFNLKKPLTFRVISVEDEFNLIIEFNSNIK